MLIVISGVELSKFPIDKYDYTDEENPVLLTEAPFKFQLLAQNMQSYLCCGTISGDEVQFVASGIVYEEVIDIPRGFEQRVLPPQYGVYLNQQQIITGLMLENKELSLTKERGIVTEQIANFNGIAQQELLEMLIEMGVL